MAEITPSEREELENLRTWVTPVEYENEVARNAAVFDFSRSVAASKYPFLTNLENANDRITRTVQNLATCPKGCGEDTFLNGIVVNFDMTFTKQAWSEAERYTFLNFVSSQSTMHCITALDIDMQCTHWVSAQAKAVLKAAVEKYNESNDNDAFFRMIYAIPSGFRLTARMTTNYRALKTIYSQRKGHRLEDWQWFADWVRHLPHSEFITGDMEKIKGEIQK